MPEIPKNRQILTVEVSKSREIGKRKILCQHLDKNEKYLGYIGLKYHLCQFGVLGVSRSGLSPIIFIIATFTITGLLVWLSLEVYEAREPLLLDRFIYHGIAQIQSHAVDKFFKMAGRMGSSAVVICIAAAMGIFLTATGRWYDLLALSMAIAGTQITTHFGKWLIHRPRPGALLDAATSFSFPSAHAASTMVIWGTAGYLIGSNLTGLPRVACLLVVGAIIISVAVSLVVRNVHYPSDVAAGLLVGTLWLIAGTAISKCAT